MPVCPLCNGLTAVRKKCPVCRGAMIDAGLLQDYYDNYSAYLDQDLYRDGYRSCDQAHCVHLLACPRCHFDTTLAVDKK